MASPTNHPDLAAEKRHTIQVAARRTGISVELLRAWERRYRAIEPDRTSTGRRLYSDNDIERLRLIRGAMVAGRRIGDLAGLSVAGLRELIGGDVATERPESSKHPSPNGIGPVIGQAFEAIRSLDPGSLRATLIRAARSLRPTTFVAEVAVPVMRRVGTEWHQGALPAAHEHAATAVLRQVLAEVLENLQPPAPAPVAVVATPAGERHEIGALAAAIVAATEGWRVLYLGADLPARDIVAAARVAAAPLVALSVTVSSDQVASELDAIALALGREAVVVVGGQGVDSPHAGRSSRVRYLTDPTELQEILHQLRQQQTGGIA